MKHLSTLITFLVFTILSVAQPTQPAAPSAAVYNYSKYADVPPNLHTGAMSEYIPLGSVSAGPLKGEVGLSYYFAGHRAADLASSAGLNFSIAGTALGAITRQVLGLDDLDPNGWLATGSEVQGLGIGGLSGPQQQDYIDELLDPQADIYSLQAGGINIKFAMDHTGNIHTIPRSDLDIKYVDNTDHNGFLLTDTQGKKYFFGNNKKVFNADYTESTAFNDKNHLSAWYLFRIETHDGLHHIDFHYAHHSYSYYSLQDCETVQWKQGSSSGQVGLDCKMTALEVTILGRVIKSITGLANSIEFNYDYNREDLLGNGALRLDNVNVKTGSYTKTYTFNHDYFSDSELSLSQVSTHLNMNSTSHAAMIKKLKLSSIDIASTGSGSSDTVPSYEFDYYRPNYSKTGLYRAYATVNKAIDVYGFANGVKDNNNEDHIIPRTTVVSSGETITFGHIGDIRRSDDNYSITTGLYKMTLPTGGTITYEYDGNQYFDAANNEVTEASLLAGGDCEALPYDEDYAPFNFTQSQINNGWIDWTFGPECPDDLAIFYILILQGGDTISNHTYCSDSQQSNTIALNTLVPALQANVAYTFRIAIVKGEADAQLKYAVTGTPTDIGGIRLSSRITDDRNGDNSNTIRRDFLYKDDNNNSSGRRYKPPVFGYGLFSIPTVGVANVLFSTASILPFTSYEGNHMGYEQATTDYNGNGTNDQKYYTDLNTQQGSLFPPVPEQGRDLWGQPKQSSSYRQSDQEELQKSHSFISLDEYGFNVPSTMYAVRRVKLWTLSGNEVEIDKNQEYKISTGTFRPDSIQTTLEGLRKTQAFDYGSSTHLQATKISDLYTNGEIYSHDLTYSTDQVQSGNDPIDSLVSRNIIVPTIDIYKINSKDVTKTETLYTLFLSHPRPIEIHRTYYDSSGATVTETDRFEAYNAKGLLTSFKRNGALKNSLFTYDTNSLMTSSGLDGLTRSFTYHTGSNLLNTITAVDGTTTTYDYDGLMRLQKITDPVGATKVWAYNISKIFTNSNIKITQTFPPDANGLSSLVNLETFSYLDGLGRAVQTVGKTQTFGGKDQVSAVAFDNQGRAFKSYETVASTNNGGDYSFDFFLSPFSLTTFEPSPLNRPSITTPPDFGTRSFTYGTNTRVIEAADGFMHPIGSIYQRTVIDGNGNKSQSFTDIQGRQILTRRMDSNETSASFIDTKNKYDWRTYSKKSSLLALPSLPMPSTSSTSATTKERSSERRCLLRIGWIYIMTPETS